MFLRLLLLFTLLPLLELWLLLSIGSRVGPVATVALVFGTGLLGAWLARSQGLQTWNKLQSEMSAGRLPSEALIDGLLILIAGAVLLTPGLITDLAGFFLLLAEGRAVIRQALAKAFETRIQYAQQRRYPNQRDPNQRDPSQQRPNTGGADHFGGAGYDTGRFEDAESGPVIIIEQQRELP